MRSQVSAETRQVSPSARPSTSAEPSPRAAEITTTSAPETGSTENATPDASASTSAWTTTAGTSGGPSSPFIARYAAARGDATDWRTSPARSATR